MSNDDPWLWSAADAQPSLPSDRRSGSDDPTAAAYAACFSCTAGRRVLSHLRAITIERRLGPDTPDTVLRFVEGQRHLVDTIAALVERGGGRLTSNDRGADDTSGVPTFEHEREDDYG